MKIFYHQDLDGEASAAIVSYSRKDAHSMMAINYNDHFPIETIEKDEEVFILDFSLQEPGMWERLLEITSNVVWIDHHERAIRQSEHLAHLPGIRMWERDGQPVAACELVWSYIHGEEKIKDGISFIGDFDCWRFTYKEVTKNFINGLLSFCDTRPYRGNHTWNMILIGVNSGPWLGDVIKWGKKALEKRAISNEEALFGLGFEVEFEGLKGICINRRQAGSGFFESVADQYDVLVSASFDGERWSVSIYAPEGSSVDMSELAAKHGGGGHRGAAGFSCNELPFIFGERLINKREEKFYEAWESNFSM